MKNKLLKCEPSETAKYWKGNKYENCSSVTTCSDSYLLITKRGMVSRFSYGLERMFLQNCYISLCNHIPFL